MSQLMNSNLIHFNKRNRMYFDRVEQEETKIYFQYKLFYIKTARQYLQ